MVLAELVRLQRCLRDFRREGRTVVARDHQRSSMLGEEVLQDRHHLFGALRHDRIPGHLIMARQI
jgi:hypothetical protein